MNKALILSMILTCFSSFLMAQDAKEIIQKLEEKQRGETSYMEITMTIVRPNWKREMKMKSWSKGDGL